MLKDASLDGCNVVSQFPTLDAGRSDRLLLHPVSMVFWIMVLRQQVGNNLANNVHRP